jgi:hypothetical protein
MHLQTRSIMASECISQFTRFLPPSASPHSLHHGLQVHLSAQSISACKCISILCPEKLQRYCNLDLVWLLARYYDTLLILPPCHGTLRVYYSELWDFMVCSHIFLLCSRYYDISCVRTSSYADDF